MRGGRHSPEWQFETMARLEASRGFRSAFYLIPLERDWTTEDGRVVPCYRIDRPDIVSLFRRLAAEGWEVGLHASYHAVDSPGGLAEETARLRRALGAEIHLTGVRSHFLRFFVPETWLHASAAGMSYDTTVGSGEGEGWASSKTTESK